MSNAYETMYIVRPDLNEEGLDQVISQYQNLLKEQGATDIQVQHRGKRRLAYEIQRFREGVYIQLNYTAEGKEIAVMERAMRLSDDVIRYLTIKLDEDTETEEAASA